MMEAEILETSSLAGLQIREMELPDGVMFGAIVRGDEVITPRSNTIANKGDRCDFRAPGGCARNREIVRR